MLFKAEFPQKLNQSMLVLAMTLTLTNKLKYFGIDSEFIVLLSPFMFAG